MMPRMDGIELTLRLKESPDTAGIPIIILTARHDLNVKVEGLTLGPTTISPSRSTSMS